MPAAGRLTADALWSLPRVGRPTVDRAGSTVVVGVTDASGAEPVTRLHRATARGLRPLTTGEASASAPSLSPSGRSLAFQRDHDGRPQLHVLPLDGGEAARVSDLPLGVVGRAVWLPDEDGLIVATAVATDDPTIEGTRAYRDRQDDREDTAHVTERRLYRFWSTWITEPTTTHLVRVAVDGGSATPVDLTPDAACTLLPGPGDAGDGVAVSPDGAHVAWSAIRDGDDEPRYLLHVAPTDGSGEVRCLTPDAPAHVTRPRFLADGRIVAGFQRELNWYAAPVDLYAVDPVTGARDPVLVGWWLQPAEWEVLADGRVVVATEERGRGVLYTVAEGTATPSRPAPTSPPSGPPPDRRDRCRLPCRPATRCSPCTAG